MRWVFSHIAGGFIRWGVATVISAMFLMLGFSPESWIKEVIETPPAWLIHPLMRVLIVGIGILIIVGFYFWDRRKRSFKTPPVKPKLVIQHDKPRDTEPWPSGDGYNVKFRVLNDSAVYANNIGARIRSLEFLEKGEWRPYGHDYAEVPLAARDGKDKFDLPGGDENSVYIARRFTRPGESIQLCYARDGIPNTIPLKPAWRVGIRLVSDNAPPNDAVFQLRVSKDESLVGMLLDDAAVDELTRRRIKANYISGIYAEAVEVRNNAFSLRVLDGATETKMDDLQSQLLGEIRDLAPERSINLETINTYYQANHPSCLLQEPSRTWAMVFSEFLRRVMKILDDYN